MMAAPEHGKTNEIDRLIDQPISDSKRDLLGFNTLSITLADTILSQVNRSTYAIGVDGPWGSGKSSILRLLIKELARREPHNSNDGVGQIVVQFSPWLISNQTALIAEFFKQLEKAVDLASRRTSLLHSFGKKNALRKWLALRKRSIRKNFRSVRKAMHRFAGLTALASTAAAAVDPTLGSALTSTAIRRFGKEIGPSTRSLEVLKSQLHDYLGQIAEADNTFRILVVIDDLDRLDPKDALEVLRLVKAVADFPAVSYLLAYDRKSLASAISKSDLIDDGDAYLEKIVQFSFKVPPLEPFQLRRWLKHELNELFPGRVNEGLRRTQVVLDEWAGRLLRTPRDVKRLLFAVRAIWPKLEPNADLLDLVWIQLVKEKAATSEADLYSWVTRYFQSLDAVAIGGMVSGTRQEQEELVRILKALGWRVYKSEDGMTSIDFHHLSKLLVGVVQDNLDDSSSSGEQWTHKIDAQTLAEYRQELRLSSPWHWRSYFAFDPPSHALTDNEWTALQHVGRDSAEKLRCGVQQIVEARSEERLDLGDQLVDRVSYAARMGSIDNGVRWLEAIVGNAQLLRKASKDRGPFGFGRDFDESVRDMVREIFRVLEEDDRQEAIDALFCKSLDLGMSSVILREQYAISREQGSTTKEDLYLGSDELDRAISCMLEQFNALEPAKLRHVFSPYDVLYTWKEVTDSVEGPQRLLEEALRDDEGFFSTLPALKCVTSSEQGGVPHLPEQYLEAFGNVRMIRNRLQKVAEEDSTHSATARELLKLWWPARKL